MAYQRRLDSLHGNLKVARRPLGAKHDKAAFQNNENLCP